MTKTLSECLPRAGIALGLTSGAALFWTAWHAAGAWLGAVVAGGSALAAASLGWQACRRHWVDRLRSEAVLRGTEKHFRMAILAGSVGTWDWDLATGKIVWSEMHERLWGMEPGGFQGTYQEFDQRLHPEDREGLNRAVSDALAHRSTYAHEYRIRWPNGSTRWIAGQGEACYDDAGQAVRMMGTVVDITGRKEAEAGMCRLHEELEQRVAERTAELKAANQELDAFSHSVSHDLRAPLRAILGFGQFLTDECASGFDERGRGYLRRMMESAARMNVLIDDLLQFAHASRSELRCQPVDLSALAQEVARELQEAEPQRRVQFLCAAGLRASGDARLLRVALTNLLGNAWKYTGKVAEPEVEFGRQGGDGECSLFIRDNGAGFDMQYVDRLFGAFQRLHSMAEFEGTGVGLATVQRIIHRHGGKIRAEAKVNGGATFYFTLPERIASGQVAGAAR